MVKFQSTSSIIYAQIYKHVKMHAHVNMLMNSLQHRFTLSQVNFFKVRVWTLNIGKERS